VGLHVVLDTADIQVRYSSTQVRIYDVHAGSAVATYAIDNTTEQVWKLALRHYGGGGNDFGVTLYTRAVNSDKWKKAISATTLTAGGSGGNALIWGNHSTSGNDSSWTHFDFVMYSGEGPGPTQYYDDLALNTLNDRPYVLYGKRIPTPPHRQYLQNGLYTRATSGPGTRGDTWKIEPRFDHPITAIDSTSSSSPQRGWRSTNTNQITVAWDLNRDSTLGNSSIGMYLGGINFPSAELMGWNGAAWVKLADLKANKGLTGLPCTVTGDTVQVDTVPASSSRYIHYGEFVGGYVKFNGGDIRPIAWNSEGFWTDKTTKRPVFRFSGTIPAGAMTTCELWHPNALVLLHENATLYDRYALRIPSTTTGTGDFRGGVCLIGGVAFFGRKYARGRVIETSPNYSLREDMAGLRTAKKRGKTRRMVSMGWTEVDLSTVYEKNANPDYISLRSDPAAPPVAARFSTPMVIEGRLEELGGGSIPVIYIPNIPETNPVSQETQMAGRDFYVYGRVVDAVSRQARLGTEVASEVSTLTGLKIEEEI